MGLTFVDRILRTNNISYKQLVSPQLLLNLFELIRTIEIDLKQYLENRLAEKQN